MKITLWDTLLFVTALCWLVITILQVVMPPGADWSAPGALLGFISGALLGLCLWRHFDEV